MLSKTTFGTQFIIHIMPIDPCGYSDDQEFPVYLRVLIFVVMLQKIQAAFAA